MTSRIHKEVRFGRVRPDLPGWEEKEIWTPRGEGLFGCWEMIWRGGTIRDVVDFLREQQGQIRRRATAILRTLQSTWVVDAVENNVRITHFKVYAPRAENTSRAMKEWWARRKGGQCIDATQDG